MYNLLKSTIIQAIQGLWKSKPSEQKRTCMTLQLSLLLGTISQLMTCITISLKPLWHTKKSWSNMVPRNAFHL